MTPSQLPVGLQPAISGTPAESGVGRGEVCSSTAGLERELSRCRRQIELVLELGTQVAELQDLEVIQSALLRGYGSMLDAGALFLDQAGCCRRIELAPGTGQPVELAPDRLRQVLAAHIEAVRRERRPRLLSLAWSQTPHLGGAHCLLATLAPKGTEVGVVVALRHRNAMPFDCQDLAAAESVLTYGAQASENVSRVRDLQRTAVEAVCTLVNAIDAKDNYTSAHSERVGGLARMIGEALGLSKPELQALEWAGLLHDVGKIGVPEQILNKPGVLSESEYEEMKKHTHVGYDVLKPVAQFDPLLDAVLYHHENYDGSGYPAGLVGEQIPLEARIIHVVDIFDALTTNRPYRRGYQVGQALQVLEAGAGRATDPRVTRLFIQTLKRYMAEHPEEFRVRFGHLADPQPTGPAGN